MTPPRVRVATTAWSRTTARHDERGLLGLLSRVSPAVGRRLSVSPVCQTAPSRSGSRAHGMRPYLKAAGSPVCTSREWRPDPTRRTTWLPTWRVKGEPTGMLHRRTPRAATLRGRGAWHAPAGAGRAVPDRPWRRSLPTNDRGAFRTPVGRVARWPQPMDVNAGHHRGRNACHAPVGRVAASQEA
jgi:hypothetical protein